MCGSRGGMCSCNLQARGTSSAGGEECAAGATFTRSGGQSIDLLDEARLDDTLASTDLHSTSHALNRLNKIAGGTANPAARYPKTPCILVDPLATTVEDGLSEYYLVRCGKLTAVEILDLVECFATTYHPFYPIAPEHAFKRALAPQTAQKEPHLLTAMITIAAKDTPNGADILKSCTQYMETLISGLTAGKKCAIEAVEALLLLAEWEPQCSLPESSTLGCGQEDMAAWMHIGIAVRIAYSLKLDRAVLRHGSRVDASREHLVWAACYLSDRQISVRIGRPFACRGPEPDVACRRPSDGDFSRVFRARLELTQIFTNVHEVLYCNQSAGCANDAPQKTTPPTWMSFEGLSLRGTVSGGRTQDVKVLLQMSYEYLRLYANAFAFQAATLRALPSNRSGETDRVNQPGSLPEARFMYDAIDAAKALLTILNNYISSATHLNQFSHSLALVLLLYPSTLSHH
ncbi:hypothetical protein BO71DRAFT_436824 [Aspergillus ellipticus CBS 707.79]|uniref:Xylanolytic transcriptional activator regulatory domain-containing protein n=1 Tax=Aspergillus ellipticus CBS 707.79 TaxID=1448320 RepID=A0A319CPI5_9EURO|nr:hypothetical protein BO71DRAFT_436824 [Aspergillus ellipticus CBS 707.79]